MNIKQNKLNLFKSLSVFVFVLLAFSFVLVGFSSKTADASSNSAYLNFQSRLLGITGAVVPDGNYNVDFKLYSTLSTGGGQAVGTCTDTGGYDCLWEETYTSGNVITVKNGYLSVYLGSITAFPSTIDWEQPLYLTMNIGGIGAPSWDGEMSPRIQLTAVPYAFNATQLANNGGGNRQVLNFGSDTGTDTITLPDASGTVCLNASASCDFLTGIGGASGTGVVLQGTTPGTPQTGDFNVSGTGIVSSLLTLASSTDSLDTATSGVLSIGNTSATSITLGANTTINANKSLTVDGSTTLEDATNSATAVQIQNAAGSNVLNVNTTTNQSTINLNFLSAPGTVLPTLAPTGVTISKLGVAGTASYTYEVTAVDSNGASTVNSTTGNITTGNAILSTTNYNVISWTAPTSTPSYYDIYRTAVSVGGYPSSTGLIGTVASTSTSFDDFGYPASQSVPNITGPSLINGTKYYFKVTALDGSGGQTLPSAELDGTTLSTNTVATTASNLSITLSWAPVTGARGYNVYYGTSSGGENDYVTTYTNSYTLSSLTPTGYLAGSPPAANTAYNDTLSNTTSTTTEANSQITLGNLAGSSSTAQLDVAGSLAVNPVSTTSTGGNAGYPVVYVSGNYAYVVDYNSNLEIIDISNPSNPVIVSTISTGSSSQPAYVYVSGSYAYIVNYNTSNLEVIDVSNPASPAIVGTVATASGPSYIYVSGHYAYIVNYNVNNIQIIDVSNPSNPIVVGTVNTNSGPNFASVSGNYLYVINYNTNNLQVINVSNPSTPIIVGTVDTDTGSGSGAFGIAVSGRYAYVTSNNTSKLKVIDISNPSDPVVVGSVATASGPNGIYLAGRYAYITNYSANNLQVIDISNPSDPVSVGTVATTTYPNSVYIQGNYAYVASYGSGAGTLQIFSLGGTYTQSLQAGSTETGSLQVDGAANVSGSESITGGLSVGQSTEIDGSLSLNGNLADGYALTTTDLPTPDTPTVTPIMASTPDVTTYSYQVAAVASNGTTSAASAVGTTAAGYTSLSSTNYNVVGIAPVQGAASYNVYRYAGGAAQGLIGAVNSSSLSATTATNYSGTGTATITFTANPFVAGQIVTLSGFSPSTVDITGVVLTATSTQITIAIPGAPTETGLGTVTGQLNLADTGLTATTTSTPPTTDSSASVQIEGLAPPGTVLPTLAPTGVTITNGGTAGTAHYSYEVTAVDSNGGSTVNSIVGSTTTGNAILSATNYNNVAWTAPTSTPSYYDIYRTAVSVGGYPSSTGLIGSLNSNTITTLTPFSFSMSGTTATIQFSNSFPDYQVGQKVLLAGFVPSGINNSGTPVVVTSVAGDNTITVTIPGGPYTETTMGTITGELNLADTGLSASQSVPNITGPSLINGTKYYFKVTALDGSGGQTLPSAELDGTTLSTNTVATTASNLSITLSWAPVTGARGYNVYYGTSSGGENDYVTTYTNSYTLSSLTPTGYLAGSPPAANTAYNDTLSNTTSTTTEANSQITLGNSVGSAPSVQLDVAGTVPTTKLGSFSGDGDNPYYIAVSGSYAYVANAYQGALVVFDVSNPENITELSSTYTGGNNANEITLSGHYVYIVSSSANIIEIFDVSNPANPVEVSSITTDLSSVDHVAVVGRYAYITNRASSNALVIFNVSNPANPVLVGSTGADIQNATSVYAQGRYAYVTLYGSSALVIFDVSNPANPVEVSSINTNVYDPSKIIFSGSYAYILGYSIAIVDINNPANPVIVNYITSDLYGTLDFALSGHYLYMTSNAAPVMTIYDVSNPLDPIFVGLIHNADGQGIAIQGSYAYLGGISDVFILYLGGTYTQSLQAGSTETTTLQVDGAANVSGGESITGGLSVGQSEAISGSLSLNGNISDGSILTTSDLPTPDTPTVTPIMASTPDVTTYSYQVAAIATNGTTSNSSAIGTTTAGYTSLSTTNYNVVGISPVQGAAGYYVYRTAGGAAQGAIDLVNSASLAAFTPSADSGTSTLILTINAHPFSIGQIVTLAGFVPAAYNVTAIITNTATNTITVSIPGSSLTAVTTIGTVTGQLNLADTGLTATTTSTPPTLDSSGVLTVTGSMLLATNTNTASAFIIANSYLTPILVVDTSGNNSGGVLQNYLSNPGFEGGTTSWAAVTGGITLNTAAADVYNGQKSLELSQTTTGAVDTTIAAGGFRAAPAAGQYTVSFFVMPSASGTTGANFSVTLTASGSNGTCTVAAPAPTGTLSTTGFTRLYCTTTAFTGTLTNLTITNAHSGSVNIYIDSVEMTAGTTLYPYAVGNVQLRGLVDTPLNIESYTNSTNLLSVYNATGTQMLDVDTLDGLVNIGTGANGDTTGYSLVLDTKTNTGDPTAVTGGMYYNSYTGNFRCAQAGQWQNCLGGTLYSNPAITTFSAVNTCTVACTSLNAAAPLALPANYCTSTTNRVIHIHAAGVYSDTGSPTISMGVYMGTSATKASDTIVGAASGTLTAGASVTSQGWIMDFNITCQSTANKVYGEGNFLLATSTTANAAGGLMYISTTSSETLSSAINIYLFPTWSASSLSNTLTLTQLVISSN